MTPQQQIVELHMMQDELRDLKRENADLRVRLATAQRIIAETPAEAWRLMQTMGST